MRGGLVAGVAGLAIGCRDLLSQTLCAVLCRVACHLLAFQVGTKAQDGLRGGQGATVAHHGLGMRLQVCGKGFASLAHTGPQLAGHCLDLGQLAAQGHGALAACEELGPGLCQQARRVQEVRKVQEVTMRKSVLSASLLALVVAVAPACATKKFVRTEVGGVNAKVDSLTKTVEETQERTRRNEERIGTVDTKAEAAGKAAADAKTAADNAANAARTVDTRLTTSLTTVNGRIDANDAAIATVRKLVSEVTLSEDQGNFKFGGADLPDEARARLDQVIGQLKSDSKNVFIEIEGHTDNAGDEAYNQKLGLDRAEAVERYLHEQHQVPLKQVYETAQQAFVAQSSPPPQA